MRGSLRFHVSARERPWKGDPHTLEEFAPLAVRLLEIRMADATKQSD
jgi:hypothetical protein